MRAVHTADVTAPQSRHNIHVTSRDDLRGVGTWSRETLYEAVRYADNADDFVVVLDYLAVAVGVVLLYTDPWRVFKVVFLGVRSNAELLSDEHRQKRDSTILHISGAHDGASMDRRQYLQALASVTTIGIAGCAGTGNGGGEETPTETPTGTPTGTATETPTATPTETDGAQQVAAHFKFGGKIEGWQGREPQRIGGTQNPTLTLEAGKKYKATWENLDGAPHNFTIKDSNGNTLTSTETMSTEGNSLSLTFTASEEMAQYICTVHPSSMVGTITIGGG